MSEHSAQAFADALTTLESGGDVDGFVASVFAEDVVLTRPETSQETSGADGARQFWRQYLDQFEQIGSTFSRVVDSGEVGLLEWSSEGRLRTGRPIDYRGVSILDYDQDGRVQRFTTYYDTASFGV